MSHLKWNCHSKQTLRLTLNLIALLLTLLQLLSSISAGQRESSDSIYGSQGHLQLAFRLFRSVSRKYVGKLINLGPLGSCLIKRLFWHAANPRNVCLELMTVATKSQPKNGALQKNFFHNSLEIIDYHHKQLHHFLIMCIKISPFFYIFMHLVYLEMRE